MTDYHSKPLLGVRVEAALQGWGRNEAKRRCQSFGDFVAGLFTAERERVANHTADTAPAATFRKPESAQDMTAAIFRRKTGDQQ